MEKTKYKFSGQINGFPLIKLKSHDIIQKIRAGSFYMNSLRVYREMYANSKDNTIGDPNEGKFLVHSATLCVPAAGVYKSIQDCLLSTCNEDDYVFCLFGINPQKHSLFTFSDEQKKELIKFGDTALLITDAYELCKRVSKAAKDRNFEIAGDFVQYYDPEADDASRLAQLVVEGMKNIVFHKTNNYAYQQEYRFTIANNTGDDHIILEIGSIEDISEVFSTEDILNSKTILKQ